MTTQQLLSPVKTACSLHSAARYLLENEPARRDIPRWLGSLWSRVFSPEVHIGRKPIPGFTFGALSWLEARLRGQERIFEWGSGASTVYFADRCQEVVSVEHVASWAELVSGKTGTGAEMMVRPPAAGCRQGDANSVRPEYQDVNFNDYVRSIHECTGEFDGIVIDGRARVDCAKEVRGKLARDGFVILDNSERARYQSVDDTFATMKRIDFEGLGPRSAAPWRTTVWINE